MAKKYKLELTQSEIGTIQSLLFKGIEDVDLNDVFNVEWLYSDLLPLNENLQDQLEPQRDSKITELDAGWYEYDDE